MGSVKDRNGMALTEVEDIKKRWQEYYTRIYTEEFCIYIVYTIYIYTIKYILYCAIYVILYNIYIIVYTIYILCNIYTEYIQKNYTKKILMTQRTTMLGSLTYSQTSWNAKWSGP